jgi:hypothetical protein
MMMMTFICSCRNNVLAETTTTGGLTITRSFGKLDIFFIVFAVCQMGFVFAFRLQFGAHVYDYARYRRWPLRSSASFSEASFRISLTRQAQLPPACTFSYTYACACS